MYSSSGKKSGEVPTELGQLIRAYCQSLYVQIQGSDPTQKFSCLSSHHANLQAGDGSDFPDSLFLFVRGPKLYEIKKQQKLNPVTRCTLLAGQQVIS
jgi:hypothetical protein